MPTAANTFSAFASEARFVAAHAEPLPANYAAMGRMITFPAGDGKAARAYLIPSKKETKNYLFVFHEWWGLNDWVKKQADQLADSLPGVNVLAIDLYDGQVTASREEAAKFMQANDPARSQSIIKGAVTYAGNNAKIATIGWCFGGGWSLQAALIGNTHVQGCVIYYGALEKDPAKLQNLNSDVLFIWPNKDQWINEQMKNDFAKAMEAAGKKLIVKEYSADHAFANPSNPNYDEVSGRNALMHTIRYLRKALAS